MKKSVGFDTVAGLLLICLFSACLFFALAAGARIYKSVSSVMEEQYTSRTAMGYVISRIHQGDQAGAVSTGKLGGCDALIIAESIDGVEYRSFIYCHEGYIKELFCPATEELGPKDGLPVITAESLEISLEGSLVRAECVTAAGSETGCCQIRSGAAA